MHKIFTDFGDITIADDAVMIEANGTQLRSWAARPGEVWPCSDLADLSKLKVTFDRGGLIDMEAVEPDAITGALYARPDLPGDEFNAWSSSVLMPSLPQDHPAWFVAVGQFYPNMCEACKRDRNADPDFCDDCLAEMASRRK